MWKWLILVLAAYALYGVFMNDRKKKGEDSKKEKERLPVATGDMVKDPVCGAYIDADSTITVRRDGQTVHRFCSYDCRDEFLRRVGKLPEKTDGNDRLASSLGDNKPEGLPPGFFVCIGDYGKAALEAGHSCAVIR